MPAHLGVLGAVWAARVAGWLVRSGARWERFCDHEPMPSRRMEWALAGALAGWAAARLAGADRLRFAEAWAVPLLSFTPQVTGRGERAGVVGSCDADRGHAAGFGGLDSGAVDPGDRPGRA